MSLDFTPMTVRDTGGRKPVIELQRRFSATYQEMSVAWGLYKDARERDEELLRAWLRKMARCQTIKDELCRVMRLRPSRQ